MDIQNIASTCDIYLQNLTLLVLIIPGIFGILGIVLLSIRPSRMNESLERLYSYLTFIGSVASFLLSLLMIDAYQRQFASTSCIFQKKLLWTFDFHIDSLSFYFVLIVNVISIFVAWNAITFTKREQATEQQVNGKKELGVLQNPLFFDASLNMFHLTMLLVTLVDNLIWLWISIELTTLFSALTVGYLNKRESWEAAWKYLIITSTGIVLALLGTMFLANAVSEVLKSTNPPAVILSAIDPQTKLPLDRIMNWTILMSLAESGGFNKAGTEGFIVVSFLFVLVGYGTKAGFAPMHTWLPDGHGEAPAPISALLSGILLKAAFYAILRFYILTNAAIGDSEFTSWALVLTGLFSLLLAVPFIMKKNPIKRVLAYHSLEHMGICMVGIGIGGLFAGKNLHFIVNILDGSYPVAAIAIFGSLLHAFNHAQTKSLLFLSYGNILKHYPNFLKYESVANIQGVLSTMPLTGSILVLGGLALVGMPPSNIFMSELIIIWGTLKEILMDYFQFLSGGQVIQPRMILLSGVLLLFMISTTLIFWGLMRHLAKIALYNWEVNDEGLPKLMINHKERKREAVPLIVLFALVIWFGIVLPQPLITLITNCVSIILRAK